MSGLWASGEEVRLAAGGKSLEGRCIGPPPERARTIVLLHEGLGSMRLWRDLPERLAAATAHGVFAYSRAGHGDSDPVALPRPLDYMTREALGVLPAVLDAIGLRQGVLLGHSDGASIATIYAGSVQDHRVRGLVLMAPHFFTEPEGLRAIANARTAYEGGDLRERLARHHQNVDITFRGWNEAWLDPGFEAWNIEDCIDYIRVPVLAIQGKQDQYGTEAQIGALAERLYAPLETVMLDDCGHAPFIAQPALTLDAISAFIARLKRIESVELERHEA